MSILSLIIYIPLQIAFIPLAILGAVLVAYRQLVISKRLGISQTAIEVLNGRWTMHIFGIREDDASAALVSTLTNTSALGLWLALFPLWLKHRISGQLFLYPRLTESGQETIADLMVSRTLLFDRLIDSRLANAEQFVIMGAGYDTRFYERFRRDGLTLFELDQPRVQAHKQEALANAGISSDHVHFVPVDFANERPFEKLGEFGFDPTRRTLVLWEGVTLYLTEADVRRTLADFQSASAPGSVLLADIYATRFIDVANRGAAGKVLEYTDEGVAFSLPFDDDHDRVLSDFIDSESLSLGERYFLGSASDKGPFAVVAEINR
jgi:methyltransferase (TIGR00027 family)